MTQSILLTDEQREFRAVVRQFATDKIVLLAAEADRNSEYSWAAFEALRAMELTALSFPVEYGGSGASLVEIERQGTDDSDFNIEFDPGNPAADDKGMVKMPNVNVLVEMADMREANRAYEANLQTIKQSRDLISQTIDLLRASQ